MYVHGHSDDGMKFLLLGTHSLTEELAVTVIEKVEVFMYSIWCRVREVIVM